jgi:hypothetical protein
MIRKAAAALIVTSLPGCGGSGEADIHGMHLVVQSERFDARTLRSQVRETAEVAASYWGGDGCQGACMGSCRYAATPDGPRLAECTWP